MVMVYGHDSFCANNNQHNHVNFVCSFHKVDCDGDGDGDGDGDDGTNDMTGKAALLFTSSAMHSIGSDLLSP